LLEEFPEITTLLNSVNETRSPVAAGVERVYHGPGTINERIRHLNFTVAPTTFFQPNTLQAERLYETVREFSGLTGNEVVYDLYSGIGCISLFLADRAQRLIAIESEYEAVEASETNAIRNGIGNCTFYAGDALEAFRPSFVRKNGTPDVLVLDPPRVGLSEALTSSLVKTRPGRIVYVSCNPATQARDLSRLNAYYEIEVVQPVDMFPHTYHIENVAALKLRESDSGVD
jgi:23S rRNA (uracil1939-C5)-methyltransferase